MKEIQLSNSESITKDKSLKQRLLAQASIGAAILVAVVLVVLILRKKYDKP